MTIEIRKVLRSDVPAVIGLLREFADYENLSAYCTVAEEDLADVVFGENAFVECLVAADEGEIIAYAIFYPNFSSFRGQKGMYLEDIFIRADKRNSGLGERMLKEIARFALAHGCLRLDLQVLDWNRPAIEFYQKHGAVRDDDERHFKFVDDAFARLAS